MAQRPENIDRDELSQKIQPVILGADYSCYAYVRAFWEAYHVRSIIYAGSDIKSISRTKFADYRVEEGVDSEDVLIPLLKRVGDQLCVEGKVPFLVTCGDFYARIVSKHKPELERWYYTPVVDFDVLDFVTQKQNFYEVCEEVGMSYPKTRFLDCSLKGATPNDEGFTYPLVAKPSNSAHYHYAEFEGKKKVFVIQSREELCRVYSALQGSCYDDSLIVQEFVPGGDSHMYALYCYVDKDSNPVFTVCCHVGLEDHHPSAIGNAVAIVPEPNEEMTASAARFLKKVGYHGMCCFDAKYDARDGSYRFLEVNARPGRSSWLVLLSGINFARIQVEDVVLGIDPMPVEPKGGWAYVGVPKAVIERCMPNVPVKERVLAAYDNGTASFALDWPGDSLAQRFWAKVNFEHQVSKFKRYLPEPEQP